MFHVRLLTLFVLGLATIGCGTMGGLLKSSSEIDYVTIRLVVTSPHAVPVYRRGAQNKVGDSIGMLRSGDTIQSYGAMTSGNALTGGTITYLVVFHGDSAFAATDASSDGRAITPAWWMQKTLFTLATASGAEAWERAQYFIANHSSYHLAVNDNALVTELSDYDKANPKSTYYKVSRIHKGSMHEYSVTAGTERDARILSYYICTGESN